MIWQRSADSLGSGLLEGWGGVVLGLLAFISVVAVCGFGVLARLRDRADNQKSIDLMRAEREKKSARETDRGDPASP